MSRSRVALLCAAMAAMAAPRGYAAGAEAPPTLATAYPDLVSGVLTHAAPGELPAGVLLRAGKVAITGQAIEDILADAPKAMREQLRKNALLLLEQVATERLLLQAAREATAQAQRDLAGKTDRAIVQDYLQGVANQAEVTDPEITKFYEANKEMCGGATLERMRPQIRQYLLQEKRQEVVTRHIQGLGRSFPIVVSAAWVKEQAVLARDNPVDKARASGRPSLVDFGATGCRPCDMMAPILNTLRGKYEGKANVVFVHVREEQILAARYSIRSIPVQVFFNKDGREVFRHTGFFPQDEIERKLAEMGVQ